jgi:hypothetical protein
MKAIQVPNVTMKRYFLLSPANCRGIRARQVLSPRATFSVAERLRSAEGISIGELFAHMSGLYFRGKLTYAMRFGHALVITPDRGLVPADTRITAAVLSEFGDGDISLQNPAYCEPLARSALELLRNAGAKAEFVLLGSVASQKYVDVLCDVFESRLLFPIDFVGRGDMSRGGLLLRAAAASAELPYAAVAGAVRRGSRPAKLVPLTRA